LPVAVSFKPLALTAASSKTTALRAIEDPRRSWFIKFAAKRRARFSADGSFRRAMRLSNSSKVHAGSTPASQRLTSGFCNTPGDTID